MQYKTDMRRWEPRTHGQRLVDARWHELHQRIETVQASNACEQRENFDLQARLDVAKRELLDARMALQGSEDKLRMMTAERNKVKQDLLVVQCMKDKLSAKIDHLQQELSEEKAKYPKEPQENEKQTIISVLETQVYSL